MTTPRIGLLGTGPWARRVHAPALAAHPGVEFTGVWGRRAEAAAALAQAHGTRPYESPDELFEVCDAVAIALPPSVQAALALRAAAAGCHLLLDKPVATTVPEARALVAAADRAGVASVVFFTARFGEREGAWIAAQAAAGGWFSAHADWLGSVFAEDSSSPYAHSPWRREKGGLWDVGPHALSVLLPVLGDAEEVTATRGPADAVLLTMRHSSGAASSATLGLTAPAAAAGVEVTLRGTAGTTCLPRRQEGPEAAYRHAVDALLAAVETGLPNACDLRFGLRVTEILAAAEEALPPLMPQESSPHGEFGRGGHQ
ncbi:Gfo/Idh/MocA family oxidoreductase [Streptomyces angustmyceticus]|uniref:Oxidoreductase n=1 Tax=Streptomyces angustmyceticus TaxID=285578 RepID=A0A5J4LIU8_9ACTN|nr:Gfo/Idh/MocA family oxidoreductase [Streptomyces angustmyceticus]UAL69547.1 Gfo/Idh/MocA family oxidoreductase [Streptomyces angustmyceticus]GES34147.1 oxidoreductase [Streptomyces angustmyceticus]